MISTKSKGIQYVDRSSQGAKAALQGFNYEKNFIAYLGARMLCKRDNITEIICEFKNDIEVILENGKVMSFQVKSTRGNTVRPEEVYDSIELCRLINQTGKYSQFVIVCNRNFSSLDMEMLRLYSLDALPGLKTKVENKFGEKLEKGFLEKIRVMKGPEPEMMHAAISDELSCLPGGDSLADGTIRFVSDIWNGLKNLKDFKIEEIEQSMMEDVRAKTITRQRLITEISAKETALIDYNPENRITDNGLMLRETEGADPNEIKYLIRTYNSDRDSRENVLRRLDCLAKNTKLYRNRDLFRFFNKLIQSNDKHVVLYFFYILNGLLQVSKKEDNSRYVKLAQHYGSTLTKAYVNWNERMSYSHGHIKDILDSLEFSVDEWCELFWDRTRNYIRSRIPDERLDKIYDNVVYLRNNNCRSLPRIWRYLDEPDNNFMLKKKIKQLLISG